MDDWLLTRFCYSPVFGVFGRLTGPSVDCFTVERPWLDNAPNVSCIPAGRYELDVDARYNRGGYDCCEVLAVPGRTHIKIHKGNTYADLQGCIAPGRRLGWVHQRWAVEESGNAFADLMLAARTHRPTHIQIVNYAPIPSP